MISRLRLALVIATVLWLLAAAQYFWGAALFEKLPRDYVAETKYAAKCRSRQSPTAPVEEYETIVRRRDQTLSSDATHSIIQGDTHWVSPEGVVRFEVISLYGVDRETRQNLPAYGNEARTGQYLFPPDTGQKQYRQWDPMYAGPRTATFERSERLDGMEVYVFNFVADWIDETSGYVDLPDVPDRYHAITFGKGRLWVEPHSGVIVDYEEEGASYFVEPKTGERVAEIFQWTSRYTPETRAEQFRLARAGRFRDLMLEAGIPGALFVLGLLSLVGAAVSNRRGRAPVVAPAPVEKTCEVRS